MPTYNGQRFLEDALASVVAQADPEIEVVAVDDGSTDETLAILRRWSRRVPMTIIQKRHSGNWMASTAEGMAAAQGQYLCWLHQDDTWRPRRAAAIRGALAKQPDAAFVVHPCWFGDGSGKRIGYWRCALPHAQRLLRFREVAAPLLVQCSIASCAAVFSTDAVRTVGLPD
ncbi:MAG: glycosyltransferase family 2 protein, partial [Pirellulales bacterium]